MRCGITGASGLLGGNLAIALLDDGHEVVAIRRSARGTEHLRQWPIDWVDASLADAELLAETFTGCDAVFHCAASLSVRREAKPWIVEANVDGTRNVLGAVRRAGVKRLVHCSTVGAVGLSVDGEPCDETATWNMADYALDDAYVTTKRQAEELVWAAVRHQGLDAVAVNPTFMIGAHDAKPSSGKLIVGQLQGKLPGYPRGKMNFVHVRDVADGMILAWQKGKTGERYILGGTNLTHKAWFDLVSDVTGAPRVTRPVPLWIARALGLAGDVYQRFSDQDPKLNSCVIRWADTERFIFTSAKAKRELGYTNRPLEQAIEDAVAWFRANAML